MINEAIRNLPPDEESEEKAMAADDDYFVEKLGEALNEVEAYMWGQSAHAVLFCALRDHHGFTDNMSRYERVAMRGSMRSCRKREACGGLAQRGPSGQLSAIIHIIRWQ